MYLCSAGLVYAGGVLYLMAASLSLVWVALLSLLLLGRRLSPLQWLGLLGVVAGFCLRVAELEGTADAVGPHVAQELFGVALVTVAQILVSQVFLSTVSSAYCHLPLRLSPVF